VAAWPALVRALLLTVQVSRVEMRSLRGRSALAAAATATPARARALVRAAARDGKALRRERLPWAVAHGDLVLAGVAAARGDAAAALAATTAAAHGFEESDMTLHAAVARRARGRLLGGDEGANLVAEAERWMSSHGVGAPARLAAVLGPGLDG
jgi:eukaryotic-like serine/threonine-protein kinase